MAWRQTAQYVEGAHPRDARQTPNFPSWKSKFSLGISKFSLGIAKFSLGFRKFSKFLFGHHLLYINKLLRAFGALGLIFFILPAIRPNLFPPRRSQ
jgi:hypothetical protein